MRELKKIYFSDMKNYFYKKITKHPDYIFYKAVSWHKKYRKAKDAKRVIQSLLYSFIANRYSSKYNLELYGKFGDNLKIWHGNIIINGNSKIGDNVSFHGNNCIGEKNGKAPVIGNNVEIGFGAIILGDIYIANNVIIGANSVVTKSVCEEGIVIAGCPAKKIK